MSNATEPGVSIPGHNSFTRESTTQTRCVPPRFKPHICGSRSQGSCRSDTLGTPRPTPKAVWRRRWRRSERLASIACLPRNSNAGESPSRDYRSYLETFLLGKCKIRRFRASIWALSSRCEALLHQFRVLVRNPAHQVELEAHIDARTLRKMHSCIDMSFKYAFQSFRALSCFARTQLGRSRVDSSARIGGILFPSPTVPFAHKTCWHGFAPCSAGMAKASESPAQHGKSSSRLRKA